MKNYVQPGEVVTLVAPSGGVTSGLGVQVGSVFAVATSTVAQGLDFEGQRCGVFVLVKATGAAWTQGAKIYWDNTAKNCTTTVSTNLFIGYAAVAAASGDATGSVILHGAG